MKEIEHKIIKARCNGFSINQLSAQDFKLDTDLLVFKLCAISGADLPGTDFFADIISTELMKYLIDFGYSEFSIEEVLLAFRLNAQGFNYPNGESADKVIFKGVLNINLLATVLNNYKILRDCLDRKFQNELEGY